VCSQVFYEQTPLDENGIKTVIETHMDETGKKVGQHLPPRLKNKSSRVLSYFLDENYTQSEGCKESDEGEKGSDCSQEVG